jgi:hypothetical protein
VLDSPLKKIYTQAAPQGARSLRSSLKISKQHSALSNQPKRPQNYDPLPTGQLAEGYKGKKTSKMTPIRLAKTTEKELRPLGDRSVELHFDVCFQQNAYGGWVSG